MGEKLTVLILVITYATVIWLRSGATLMARLQIKSNQIKWEGKTGALEENLSEQSRE